MSICTFEISFLSLDDASNETVYSTRLPEKYDIDPGDKAIISIIGDVVSNFENVTELTVDQSIAQSDHDNNATFSFAIDEIVSNDELDIFYKKIDILISNLETALLKYKI